MKNPIKIILIPGNGAPKPTDGWYSYVKGELSKFNFEVINKVFPDPIVAREKYWLPFITELGANEKTILMGHSSGAVAAMRYAETKKILGSILVGACYTDLGEENEKASGYYDHPWDWQAIIKNQNWIVQFASTDDPFIPISEARYIHEQLKTEYHEYTDQGHFMDKKFPQIIEALKSKIEKV